MILTQTQSLQRLLSQNWLPKVSGSSWKSCCSVNPGWYPCSWLIVFDSVKSHVYNPTLFYELKVQKVEQDNWTNKSCIWSCRILGAAIARSSLSVLAFYSAQKSYYNTIIVHFIFFLVTLPSQLGYSNIKHVYVGIHRWIYLYALASCKISRGFITSFQFWRML